MSKNYWLLIVIFFIISSVFVYITLTEEEKKLEEETVVLSVNGIPFTESEFEKIKEEVTRDLLKEGDSNLSPEKIRERAADMAARIVIRKEYFNEKGVTVSSEEIEDALMKVVANQPGVERKEEFFDLMKMSGIQPEEFERELIAEIKANKVRELLMREIEVEEEEIEEKYDHWKKAIDHTNEIEGRNITLLPMDDIRDLIIDEIKKEKVEEILLKEYDDRREATEILFLNN